MNMKVYHGRNAELALMHAVQEVAKIVGLTMGACGRLVLIDKDYGPPEHTKDGIHVLRSARFKDRMMQLAVSFLKEIAGKVNDVAGDGTTTTTVLVSKFLEYMQLDPTVSRDPISVSSGIEKAVLAVVKELEKMSRKVKSGTDIRQIATVSANGDDGIGQLIMEAFEKVGHDGVVTIEEGKGHESSLDVVQGMNFDRGFVSPYFATNKQQTKAEFDNAYILVYDGKISNAKSIVPILEKIYNESRPLLIIADDIDGEALATLILNRLQGAGLKICAVKSPSFGERRKAMLEDIAVVTGGKLISEELGVKLTDVTLDQLGRAAKVVISKDGTTIVDGQGSGDGVKARCDAIKAQIEESTSDYDKEKLRERLGKLCGGVAVIKVGGVTEQEIKEKKFRLEDALNAVRAAIVEGVVLGGGCALLKISGKLKNFKGSNPSEDAGIAVVLHALQAPIKRILMNGYLEPAVIVDKLLNIYNTEDDETDDTIFDVRAREYVKAFKAGLIDPTKVVRVALESAASAAKLIARMGCMMIKDDLSDKKDTGGGGSCGSRGGMGSMGGMGMGGMGDMGEYDDMAF